MTYSSFSFSNIGKLPEGAVRAAFIFKIMKYTQWENLPLEYIDICVAGDAGSAEFLNKFEALEFRGKAIKVDMYDSVRGLSSECNVVVWGKDKARGIDETLLNSSLLLICDGCESGMSQASVEIVKHNNSRLKFSVNLPQAKRAKIKFGSAMLEVAAKVVKE